MKEKEEQRLKELKKIEKEIYNTGVEKICGIDEAGRGPLAGPVVVAAVIMPRESFIEGVNDSKKVSEKKRETLYEKIINEQNQKIHTEKNNQPIFMDQHAVHAFNRISRFVYLK